MIADRLINTAKRSGGEAKKELFLENFDLY